MIKYVLRIILMMTFVTGILCQYGIPDDDDDVPVRVSPVQLTTAAPQPTPVTPEVKMTYYEDEVKLAPPVNSRFSVIRNQPQYSPSPVKIAPPSTPLPVKAQSVQYSAPVVVRTEAPVTAAPKVEKIEIRDTQPVYTAKTAATPPVVKKSYSAPSPAPLPVRVQSVKYNAPVVARTEAPVTAAPKVEKIQIKDSQPAYAYTAKTPASPPLVKQSYSAKTYSSSEVRKEPVPIVKFLLEDDNYGTFKLETVSGDGTVSSKSGTLKNLGDKEGLVQVMQGAYRFTGDDGKVYSVTWTADEEGFRATGDHLPTPPPAQY